MTAFTSMPMDPTIAPSLEGLISRLASALALIAGVWSFLHYWFDPQKRSKIHRYLEAFFLALGRQWQTIALLLLAFSIATIVPIYENASLKRQMMDQICRETDSEPLKLACKEAASKLPKYDLSQLLEGGYVDVFQLGLWLLTLFFVGVFANILIVNAKTTDTRGRVVLVSIIMSFALWGIGVLQDFLGR